MQETGELDRDDAERNVGTPRAWPTLLRVREKISVDELELTVDLASGHTLRLHRRCHRLWGEKCEPLKSASLPPLCRRT